MSERHGGDRGKELGRFLRTRRAGLRPADVGIEVNAHRRAPGLRREEVARLAHVSVGWYVHLEQGRRIPSSAVLDNLSSALRLDRAEHVYVHALAAPTSSSTRTLGAPDPEAVETARALVELHARGSLPVFALDGRGEVVAANDATSTWYADFSGRGDGGTNFLWWLYTDPAAREKVADWREVVRDYTAGVRYHAAATGTGDGLAELLDRLDEVSAEFHTDWRTYDVADPVLRRRTLVHPVRGRVELQVVAVQPTIRPSIVVVFHVERSPAATPDSS